MVIVTREEALFLNSSFGVKYHLSKTGRYFLLPRDLDSYERKSVSNGGTTLIFSLVSVYSLASEHFLRRLIIKVMECDVSLLSKYDSGENVTVYLVRKGNVRMLQTVLMFTKCTDINLQGKSLLHYSNDLEMTSFLMSKGLSVTKTDEDGNTPLFYCTDRSSLLLMSRRMSDYNLCNIFVTIVWKRQLDFAVRLVQCNIRVKSSYIAKCPDSTTKRYLLQESRG